MSDVMEREPVPAGGGRFIGLIDVAESEQFRRRPLTDYQQLVWDGLRGISDTAYVLFRGKPLRLSDSHNEFGARVRSAIDEGTPDVTTGDYGCLAISVIELPDGSTFEERHWATERREADGSITILAEPALGSADICPDALAAPDFFDTMLAEAQPIA